MTPSTPSLWTILKQTIIEQGKGSCKRVLAYILTSLASFIIVHAQITGGEVDYGVLSQLLIAIGALLSISAFQQIKGVKGGVVPPILETVNPDNPNTPPVKG